MGRHGWFHVKPWRCPPVTVTGSRGAKMAVSMTLDVTKAPWHHGVNMTMTVNRHGYEVRRGGTLIVRLGGGTGGVAWLQASEYVIARGWFTRNEINAMA
jgi:hypothetical protein